MIDFERGTKVLGVDHSGSELHVARARVERQLLIAHSGGARYCYADLETWGDPKPDFTGEFQIELVDLRGLGMMVFYSTVPRAVLK